MYTNVWCVAGFSTDLSNEPIKVTMLGADPVASRCDHDAQAVAPGIRTDAYATVKKYGLIWVCL